MTPAENDASAAPVGTAGRLPAAGLAGLLLLATTASLSACSADQADSKTTPTPSSTVRQVVTVAADPDSCVIAPPIVNAGTITIRATAVGDESQQVTVYGPKNGQFSLAYGTIPRLRPGQTKAMTVTLKMGAYEISCATDRDDERSRLTTI